MTEKKFKLLWTLTIINTIVMGLIFALFLTTPISILSGSYSEEYFKDIKKFVNERNEEQNAQVKQYLMDNEAYTEESIKKLYDDYNSGNMN